VTRISVPDDVDAVVGVDAWRLLRLVRLRRELKGLCLVAVVAP
jgi:hypothetical protein